jgi:hypothetical protein
MAAPVIRRHVGDAIDEIGQIKPSRLGGAWQQSVKAFVAGRFANTACIGAKYGRCYRQAGQPGIVAVSAYAPLPRDKAGGQAGRFYLRKFGATIGLHYRPATCRL